MPSGHEPVYEDNLNDARASNCFILNDQPEFRLLKNRSSLWTAPCENGASAMLFCSAPWSGLGERHRFDALFYCVNVVSSISMVTT